MDCETKPTEYLISNEDLSRCHILALWDYGEIQISHAEMRS